MFKPKVVMFFTLVIIAIAFSCSSPESDQPVLPAELPLHLEEHINDARIEGSEVPEDVPASVEWNFDEPRPEWIPVDHPNSKNKAIETSLTEDSLRLFLGANNVSVDPFGKQFLQGGIYVKVPDWKREDWAYIVVRARSSENINEIRIGFNLRERPGSTAREHDPFLFSSAGVNIINDGMEHTYLMRADWSWENWEDPWKQLIVLVRSDKPAHLDILSVRVIPKGIKYLSDAAGVQTEMRNEIYRRVLFVHTPAKLSYRVRVPEGGRLDIGLGLLRDDVPVTFQISAKPDRGDSKTLLNESYSDKKPWAQRSVNLSNYEDQTITLTLQATADQNGTVALWGAPTISSNRVSHLPDIIFYIIDGAGADYLSVYGYNRRTTPNLERLAEEGAVFENAFSNSSWTKPSTPSFMTSLHHSVLGGYKTESDPLPDQAVPMAEHLHRAGYQTAVFTTNPLAGALSGLERGVDVMRDSGCSPNSRSSEVLHDGFWKWRESYPGHPYWVHFQTTDVHWPFKPPAPFAGVYVEPKLRKKYYDWERKLAEAAGLLGPTWNYPIEAFKKAGIGRPEFYNVVRGLYDETMAHNDYQIGQLVKRLKDSGAWEHTLFIVAADHGQSHGFDLLDPKPKNWGASAYSFNYRIPLVVIWPGKIASGLRISQPVSMIDLMPTTLELAGLPPAETVQGQSLVPLLLGKGRWEPRPVILDEFYFDSHTGILSGWIQAIDERWIAGLGIKLNIESGKTSEGDESPRFYLADRWIDPHYGGNVRKKYPDISEKYINFLKKKWREHQELAKLFSRSNEGSLTPEQLETLRSLGYIR
jgi:arylsulfatase A-like enzyme